LFLILLLQDSDPLVVELYESEGDDMLKYQTVIDEGYVTYNTKLVINLY